MNNIDSKIENELCININEININKDTDKIKYINSRIKNELCLNILDRLKNENLINIYTNTVSVKNKISILENILKNNNIDDIKIKNIINDYITNIIPPGTKGVIRGNLFNQIVKKYIHDINLDENLYNIEFEKKCIHVNTDEIPDWYIHEISTNKTLIGMNQLDLWGGGEQLNRGYKYIVNSEFRNNKNIKLLCVIANTIILKSAKNKVYNIFDIGFTNNTLCYITNLKNIIHTFFNIV